MRVFRYNCDMDQLRRLGLWFAMAVVAVVAVAAIVWVRGAPVTGSSRSPLPTPPAAEASTSLIPSTSTPAAIPPSPGVGAGAALLWVALGAVLALGIIFVTISWHRRTAQ